MARYREAKCRICRREGVKLFLKGERCHKRGCCPIDKSLNPRNYPPGEHGLSRRQKPTDYAIRLREKQKLRRMYGLLEKQFRTYFRKAARQSGVTGDNLLCMLEMRLDNVVYRLGYALSRDQARQMVTHGVVRVNGAKADIPSYQVKPGDVITLKEKALNTEPVKYALEWNASRLLPEWLSFDAAKSAGKVEAEPSRDMISVPVEEQLIVEFYSRV